MHDSEIDGLLQPLLQYFKDTLDKARNLTHTLHLSEITYSYYYEGIGLAEFTIQSIKDHREHIIGNDLKCQIIFLEFLKKKLIRLFDLTDPITEAHTFNLKAYHRDSIKYNYGGYLKEIGGLVELWAEKMDAVHLQNHSIAVSGFQQQNYMPRSYFKLPFLSEVNEKELLNLSRDLVDKGLFDPFAKFAFESDWSIATEEVKPYLIKVLAYDIGSIKSQVLWDILGYILIELDDLKKDSIYFKDLFVNQEAYAYTLKQFKSELIFDRDGAYLGLALVKLPEKTTVGSLLAISEVLTQKSYINPRYSRSEQVRAMGRTFNMTISPAAESKKLIDHDKLVSKLNEIIPLSYSQLP